MLGGMDQFLLHLSIQVEIPDQYRLDGIIHSKKDNNIFWLNCREGFGQLWAIRWALKPKQRLGLGSLRVVWIGKQNQ